MKAGSRRKDENGTTMRSPRRPENRLTLLRSPLHTIMPFQREEVSFGATVFLPTKGKLKLASSLSLGSIMWLANVQDKASTRDGE